MNNNRQIRPAQVSDLPKIIEIEQAAHVSPWTSGVIADCLHHYDFWLITIEEQIIGYTVFTLRTGECEIFNLAITPAYQHQGYGKQLLTKVLQHAQAHQINHAFLEVRISNHNAIELYRTVGFNEIGRRKNYYRTSNGHEDAILLGLSL